MSVVFTTPSCNAINALSVLNGEPGGYIACNPLSKRGLAILSLYSFVKFFDRFLPTKRFGLYDGPDTIASISPDAGSMAMIPPRLFFINSSP